MLTPVERVLVLKGADLLRDVGPRHLLALANVVDVTMYLYQRMQVHNATEVAAQAAWKTCDLTVLPPTTDCSTLAA